MAADEPPNNVVNLRGRMLFPAAMNRHTLLMETSDSKPIKNYAALVICALCKTAGKVYLNKDPSQIVHCPDCNGFGYTVRFLRNDQVNAPAPPPTPTDSPKL